MTHFRLFCRSWGVFALCIDLSPLETALCQSLLINGICNSEDGTSSRKATSGGVPNLTISTSEPISVVVFIGERVA